VCSKHNRPSKRVRKRCDEEEYVPQAKKAKVEVKAEKVKTSDKDIETKDKARHILRSECQSVTATCTLATIAKAFDLCGLIESSALGSVSKIAELELSVKEQSVEKDLWRRAARDSFMRLSTRERLVQSLIVQNQRLMYQLQSKV